MKVSISLREVSCGTCARRMVVRKRVGRTVGLAAGVVFKADDVGASKRLGDDQGHLHFVTLIVFVVRRKLLKATLLSRLC